MKKVKLDLNAAKRLLKIGSDRKTVDRIVIFFIATILTTLISPVISYFTKITVDLLTETYALGNMQVCDRFFSVIAFVISLIE